jgi:hypothetical protein
MSTHIKHTDSPSPSPITSARYAAVLLYALFALALAVAGWEADPRAWGVHQFAFLPRPLWAAGAAILVLLLVPRVATWTGAAAVRAAAFVCASPRRTAVTALASGALFYVGRIDFPFLGDGVAWVGALGDRTTLHNFEPLAVALTRACCNLVAPKNPEPQIPLFSVLLGPAYVAATAGLVRTVWQDVPSRGLAWILLVVNPLLLLYFGYVESYPVLVVLQVLFAFTLVKSARGRVPAVLPAAVLGVAVAAHLSAVAWSPALVALVRSPNRRDMVRRAALALLTVLAVAAVAIVATGDSPLRLLGAIPSQAALGGQSARWFFSFHHLLDLANELVLTLGPALLVLAAVPPRGISFRSLCARPEILALAWLLPGPLLLACIVQPRIGGARDWDLFLPLVLPAVLCGVELWRAALQPERAPQRAPGAGRPAWAASWTAGAGRAVGLACVATAGWLGVELDGARAARRMLVLQEPAGTFGNFARGYANETLGIYFRNRDRTAARDAWLRATQANPKNGRYFSNLGMNELQLGRNAAACADFRRALELGMEEYFVFYNLAACERTAGNLEAAEQYYTTCITRWPSLWQAWSARGLVRVLSHRPQEALTDLQRAAASVPLDAETQRRLAMAFGALGRADEARAAWENAARLDRAH